MILLMWLLLLSLATFTPAATPGYVGIETNDSFTWNTTYDEDALEDMIEDSLEEDGYSDSYIENYVDLINVDEDAIKIKIVILDVDDEEKDPWGEDGVRIIYNYYIGYEDADEEWDLEQEDETWAIWDFDDEWYVSDVLDFNWEFDTDDDDPDDWDLYTHLKGENPWFVSTKTKWNEIEEELEDIYDDENYDDYSVKRSENGIKISNDKDDDDDFEEREWLYEYGDNGVLTHFQFSYDGDPIVIVQTQESQIRQFISENMIWIIIGAVGIVAVIVVVVILLFKRRK